MKTSYKHQYLALVVIVLAASASLSGRTWAKGGVIVWQARSYQQPCVEYAEVKEENASYLKVKLKSGKNQDFKKSKVFYRASYLDFNNPKGIDSSDLERCEESLKTLNQIYGDYPQTKEFIKQRIMAYKTAISQLNAGKECYYGVWGSKGVIAKVQAKFERKLEAELSKTKTYEDQKLCLDKYEHLTEKIKDATFRKISQNIIQAKREATLIENPADLEPISGSFEGVVRVRSQYKEYSSYRKRKYGGVNVVWKSGGTGNVYDQYWRFHIDNLSPSLLVSVKPNCVSKYSEWLSSMEKVRQSQPGSAKILDEWIDIADKTIKKLDAGEECHYGVWIDGSLAEKVHKKITNRLDKELAKLHTQAEYSVCFDRYKQMIQKIGNAEMKKLSEAVLAAKRERYSTARPWLISPIQLGDKWRTQKGNKVAKANFSKALSTCNVKAVLGEQDFLEALKPVAGLSLFGPVNYLDPIQVALKKMKASGYGERYKLQSEETSSKLGLESGAFPSNTFYYYSYDVGRKREEVNRLIFIVDSADRVVAVQEVIQAPQKTWLYNHQEDLAVYDFIRMRRKAVSSYKVGYQYVLYPGPSHMVFNDKVVVFDAEIINRERKAVEWVRLHIPLHIAKAVKYWCDL